MLQRFYDYLKGADEYIHGIRVELTQLRDDIQDVAVAAEPLDNSMGAVMKSASQGEE